MAASRTTPCAARHWLLLSLLFASLGCEGQRQAQPPHDPAPPLASASADARESHAAPAREPGESPASERDAACGLAAHFAGTSLSLAQIEAHLTAAPMLAFRPVGSSSIVFKVSLQAPVGAALKVATVERKRGPHAEVAAYRLARCLSLSNVPPAVPRRVTIPALRAGFSTKRETPFSELEGRLLVAPDRHVEGAAIYWIEGLRELGLESKSGQERMTSLLSLATPLAAADEAFSAQLGTLISFDYLIANWDRWSGSNLTGDPSGTILYARDHDASFAARIGEPLHRRMLDRVLATQRFSRSFVEALRRLTRSRYEAELAREPLFTEPLLDSRRLDGLFDRRATLLSHIDALIEEHGRAAVLCLP